MSHLQAVKHIGRYLLGTKDKGIIMTPDPSHSIEVFTDADYGGLYNPETALLTIPSQQSLEPDIL
jgi:hypothetical protein